MKMKIRENSISNVMRNGVIDRIVLKVILGIKCCNRLKYGVTSYNKSNITYELEKKTKF